MDSPWFLQPDWWAGVGGIAGAVTGIIAIIVAIRTARASRDQLQAQARERINSVIRQIDVQCCTGEEADIDATFAMVVFNYSPEILLRPCAWFPVLRGEENERTYEQIPVELETIRPGHKIAVIVNTEPGELLLPHLSYTDVRGARWACCGGELVIEVTKAENALLEANHDWPGADLDGTTRYKARHTTSEYHIEPIG